MRIKQQQPGGKFDYMLFKNNLDAAGLSPMQLVPLQQRLDTLESFMPQSQTSQNTQGGQIKAKFGAAIGNDWTPKVCIFNITPQHR